jgi:hypothetical protein
LGKFENQLFYWLVTGLNFYYLSGTVIASSLGRLASPASERFHTCNSFKIAKAAEPFAVQARSATYIDDNFHI